jgi:hypothetical protein
MERKFVMPVKPLPPRPDLDHLKHQAKDLLRGHAARQPDSAQRIREFHPKFAGASDPLIFTAPINLSAAQFTIAREYGFASWARLKAHVASPLQADKMRLPHHERIEDAAFRRAVDLLDSGDAAGLSEYLKNNPNLARQRVMFEGGNYFRNPGLLQFVAENPVRHGVLPSNIVEVAEVILAAGAEQSAVDETLMLVSTGRVPRECGVQNALIDLFCDHGADPNPALGPAAAHGEFGAVDALIRRGARMDLPVAAALGREDEFRRMLPAATAEDRHRALALAAQFGRVEIARLLLDRGEDPNRYNPPGNHSHSTPLHQAAYGGHEALVRLLLEHGASTEMKDLIWSGTAADWAFHGGHRELEALLRA